MVICLEQDADLLEAQLMPLPLTVSCFSKIQIGFTFLVPVHPVVLEKGPLNGCVYFPQTPSSLASFESRPVLPFWHRLTQVVLEKRPLNRCSSSSSSNNNLAF